MVEIGSSLYDVLKSLQLQGFQLKFIFDPNKIVEVPYIVLIKSLSIRLLFNGSSQLLEFIELNKFDNLNIHYKGNKINGLNLKKIYNNSFGPTYPGEVQDGNYYLSYPGISFRFQLPNDLKESKKDILVDLLEEDNLIVESIIVHNEENWKSVYDKHIIKDEDQYVLLKKQPKILIQSKFIKIERLDCIIPLGKIKIIFQSHPDLINDYEIILNKTLQQDILSIIGPPDEIFLKNDSRLTIHEKKDSKEDNHEIFHNYFRYGFDILYDISSNQGSKIKKIILHNNLPNSLFFQKYKKCIWRMIGYETSFDSSWERFNKSNGVATSEMYFSEISSNFKKCGNTTTSSPIILNRNDLFNSLENSIEFITIDEEDDKYDKTWGQVLIYAYKRCIWEILSVNNGVNSITLY